MTRSFCAFLTILFLTLVVGKSFGQDSIKDPRLSASFSGNFRIDYRYFPNEALYPGQHSGYASSYFQPELYMEWNKGNQLLQITGFGRLDQYDTVSTHVDLREMYWQLLAKKWELSVGAKKIFWGITESNHVVDIINQSDGLEGFDLEQKLGQPMAHFSTARTWGTIDLIGMAYHRQLKFPGLAGRPRPPSMIDYDSTVYESEYNEYQPEVAVRWSHSFWLIDLGITHFYGASRAPIFLTKDNINFKMGYEMINQSGIDFQLMTGSMFWKFEGIYRQSDRKVIRAYVGGGEYTISNMFRSGIDLGLIVEYNYDDRGQELISALDNDMFFGMRFAFNDRQSTDLLAGYIVDMENFTQRYFIEANRRLGETWKLSLEASGFENVADSEFIYLIRKDGFGKVSLIKYF